MDKIKPISGKLFLGKGSSQTSLLKRRKAGKYFQYIAAFSASLSAFSIGNVIGWTSQISPKLLRGDIGFTIDENQLGWVGSLVALGAACMALFVGYICDKIGRKTTKLLLVLPISVGWGLLAWATNVQMLYIGRFLTGMVGGAYMVTSPLYCNEISQKEVRGALGSLTQLMLASGLLFDAIIGKYATIKTYTICCFAIPLIFACLFVFMPETPTYYLKKNKDGDAEKILSKLRSENYDIYGEIAEIKTSLCQQEKGGVFKTFAKSWTKRSTRMACFITVTLMILRALSGVDAITTYTSYIFATATSNFDPEIGTIILMVVQLAVSIFQSLVIDRIGRRILLLISEIVISMCLLTVGLCFLLKNRGIISENDHIIADYLSLAALCVYCIGFSLGIAAIPLILNAELNPQETKSLVASFATFCSWIFIFIVTKTFLIIEDAIGVESAFMIYGCLSLGGAVFIWCTVPETKGKTPEEIRILLERG